MSDTEIASVSDIFSALGGNSAVARALGLGTSTTSEMKRRGRIPAEYWCDLVDAAHARGGPEITLEMLARLHARKRPTSAVGGFSEEGTDVMAPQQTDFDISGTAKSSHDDAHFSRWKHLRQHHFVSGEDIVAHVRALRDEWDRR